MSPLVRSCLHHDLVYFAITVLQGIDEAKTKPMVVRLQGCDFSELLGCEIPQHLEDIAPCCLDLGVDMPEASVAEHTMVVMVTGVAPLAAP